jgi:hypothetical protein
MQIRSSIRAVDGIYNFLELMGIFVVLFWEIRELGNCSGVFYDCSAV